MKEALKNIGVGVLVIVPVLWLVASIIYGIASLGPAGHAPGAWHWILLAPVMLCCLLLVGGLIVIQLHDLGKAVRKKWR